MDGECLVKSRNQAGDQGGRGPGDNNFINIYEYKELITMFRCNQGLATRLLLQVELCSVQ